MNNKQRLSVSVDADLIRAAEEAVKKRRSDSISAWVNEALRSKLEHERRLHALTNFIEVYESEHGEITPDDMRLAARRARANAITVRGIRSEKAASKRKPAKAR